MQPAFDTICRHLHQAHGRDRALTLASLANAAAISRREAEQIIETRLADIPFVVVAGPTGYFRPNSADDINHYVRSLHKRHRRMQIREATIRRKARANGWPTDPAGRFIDPPAVSQLELFPC